MKIRLPADLKEEIEAAAKQSGRSMNAEIVARLLSSFEITHPDRIAVDTAHGIKVYAPESELPSAEDIADKVADKVTDALAGQMIIPLGGMEALENILLEMLAKHHGATIVASPSPEPVSTSTPKQKSNEVSPQKTPQRRLKFAKKPSEK